VRDSTRGRVVWITGLSGSGKTTVAGLLVKRLRASGLATVLLDGDDLRRSIAADLGYDLDDRRRCARRYARLAASIALQGLTVVVATISMFEAIRRWTRRHAPRYLEVYLRRPPIPQRRRAGARARLVVGVDLPFEAPVAPDLTFDVPATSPTVIVARIETWMRRGR
jgi:adenylylsulfate kinase